MKVAELEGALLDLWVARAEGESIAPAHSGPDPDTGSYWLQQGNYGSVKECPRYSSDWAQGGPIIERERIGIELHGRTNVRWGAWITMSCYESNDPDAMGPTPLIAAMRSYVASKFGNYVPEVSQ